MNEITYIAIIASGYIKLILSGINGVLSDLWYVNLRGLHKHEFVRGEDVQASEGAMYCGKQIKYPHWECSCGATSSLDPWQMRQLPPDMLYVKIQKASNGMLQ
jgi:hypothetical protein